MTSLYFSFQARLARLRETGELPPAEYGADVGPSEYLKVCGDLQFHSQSDCIEVSTLSRPSNNGSR
jgi:hypothetical protein